jgi:hypothetical protein
MYLLMEAGMMGCHVGPVGSFTKSIPGASPLIQDQTEQGNFITFSITDDPGRYFKNVGGEKNKRPKRSLSIKRYNRIIWSSR